MILKIADHRTFLKAHLLNHLLLAGRPLAQFPAAIVNQAARLGEMEKSRVQ